MAPEFDGPLFDVADFDVAAFDVEYQADGMAMLGRMALPAGEGPVPGVLIAHEANGLDDYQRSRPEKLAELGYAALAMDYHGGGRVYADREEMMARLEAIGSDPDRLRALARPALEVLTRQPGVDPSRVAAIGYCFGAAVVMELARSGADIKAVVGFHPGRAECRPEDAANIVGRVLMCVGADDPIIPTENRVAFVEEMRAGGVDWRMNLYGGVQHSFTHPNAASAGVPGLEYNQLAADRSWRAMLDLFDEVFSP
jgi:dienelactone hydrolase